MHENVQKPESTRIRANVRDAADGKTFEVLVGSSVVGTAKHRFDADFHMHAINAALEHEFKRGYFAGRLDGIHDSE